MADNQFLQQFDEAMEQRGAIIGGEKVDVLTEDEVDDATTIPATKIDSTSGEAVGWYVAPLSVIMKPIRAAISTLSELIASVTQQGNRAEQAAGQVDAVIATANTDHTRAEQDHSTATSDHTTAQSDHTTAQSDHTTAGQDHTRSENIVAHPPYIADGTTDYPGDTGYFYSWDYGRQTYVRQAKLSLDWQSMTQAERDALADEMYRRIVVATVAECRLAMSELT